MNAETRTGPNRGPAMKRPVHTRYKRVGALRPPPLPEDSGPSDQSPERSPNAPSGAASNESRRPNPIEAQNVDPEPATQAAEALFHVEPSAIAPPSWTKGQLLNVRHGGPGYRITLLGEEYDPRYPERCLEFSNGGECQNFVSNWYSRESHDPRAG
jgi:hypothetical protein